MGKRSHLGPLLPGIISILAIPFGIALQNILAFVAICLCLVTIQRNWCVERVRHGIRAVQLPVLAALSFVVWVWIAGALNPANPIKLGSHHPFGYVIFILAPALACLTYPQGLPAKAWHLLGKVLAIVAFAWGVCVLTQVIWGWRLIGHRMVFGQFFRPRGFSSHPLTLAYAAFLLWSLCLNWVFVRPRAWQPWVCSAGVLLCLVLSQSRTIQVAGMALLFWNAFFLAKKHQRAVIIGTCLLFLSTLVFVPNPISRKFVETFSGTGVDRQSDYPDDRLAFWHVHWNMVKERPITGHGFALNTAYRLPYYDNIGLGGFGKPYEAHNMFLQILANGGLIGLSAVLFWFYWWIRFARLQADTFLRRVGTQTAGSFAIVGISQNAIQDASVRMILSLLAGAFFVACYSPMFLTSRSMPYSSISSAAARREGR